MASMVIIDDSSLAHLSSMKMFTQWTFHWTSRPTRFRSCRIRTCCWNRLFTCSQTLKSPMVSSGIRIWWKERIGSINRLGSGLPSWRNQSKSIVWSQSNRLNWKTRIEQCKSRILARNLANSELTNLTKFSPKLSNESEFARMPPASSRPQVMHEKALFKKAFQKDSLNNRTRCYPIKRHSLKCVFKLADPRNRHESANCNDNCLAVRRIHRVNFTI